MTIFSFKRCICAVLFLMFSLSGPLCARELSWNDALSGARTKNPALLRAREALDQAKAQYGRAGTNFLPQISGTAAATQGDSGLTSASKDYSYGISGSLSLFTGFANVSELRSRDYDVKIAEENYRRTLSDTLFNLKQSFTNLLWAQETVKLSENILARRQENYDMVQLKYQAGTEDKGSLMRIDADRAQSSYDLAKAQRALLDASLALSQAIGYDTNDTDLAAAGALTAGTPPASFDLTNLLAATPEHAAALYTLRKAETAITAAQSSFYPDLAVTAGTSRSGPQWGPDRGRWSAGLSLSYPFFSGGKSFYDVRIARSGKAQSEQLLRQTDEQLAVTLHGDYTAFVDSSENLQVRQKYLTASETQSRITTAKYINGLTSYQDWYIIENDYINSQRTLLNARRDVVLSEAQLKNALGAGEY